MHNWVEITSSDTLLFSDSTEISPNAKFCLNCCYQLNEKTGIRAGSVSLIDIDNKVGEVVAQITEIDGILDCSWINETSVVLASASGRLHFYDCDYTDFIHLNTVDIDLESLSLSVDFCRDKILCSTSKGSLCLINCDHNVMWSRKVHEYEAWVCHLSRHHDNLYYSGGDDCTFFGFDLREENRKLFTKKFEMGVTSLGSHPTKENIVSVGGYDERLRLYDLRNMAQELNGVDVGGGIWRHKWCPDGGTLVLVAAMYAGFATVDTADGSVMRHSATSHKDGLAYGADWVCRGSDYLLSLSSFYDHRWSLSQLSVK